MPHVPVVVVGAGPLRPGHEPLPRRALDRPRGPRARRGGATPGARSAGTPCGCSRRTGSAGCRAGSTTGPDPDGFMTAAEIGGPDRRLRAPRATPRCRTGTTVTAVRAAAATAATRSRRSAGRLDRRRRGGRLGPRQRPQVPALGEAAAGSRRLAHRIRLPNPDQVADGGGPGGRRVGERCPDRRRAAARAAARSTIAVGEHVRVPRRYRGADILWWMESAGVLDERYDEMDDLGPRAQHPLDAARRARPAASRSTSTR